MAEGANIGTIHQQEEQYSRNLCPDTDCQANDFANRGSHGQDDVEDLEDEALLILVNKLLPNLLISFMLSRIDWSYSTGIDNAVTDPFRRPGCQLPAAPLFSR